MENLRVLELYSGMGGMHYALKGKPDINAYRTRLCKECILSEVKMTAVGLDETPGNNCSVPSLHKLPGTTYRFLKPSVFMWMQIAVSIHGILQTQSVINRQNKFTQKAVCAVYSAVQSPELRSCSETVGQCIKCTCNITNTDVLLGAELKNQRSF